MMEKKKRFYGTTGLFAQPLGGVLDKVTAPAMQKQGWQKARLMLHWPEIVGSEIAAKCTPYQLTFPANQKTGGTLTLRVKGAFALELQHLEPFLLEKLAVFLGYRAIDRIRLQQRG
jgi:hypothetical protein